VEKTDEHTQTQLVGGVCPFSPGNPKEMMVLSISRAMEKKDGHQSYTGKLMFIIPSAELHTT
jgi:hypothetical protein